MSNSADTLIFQSIRDTGFFWIMRGIRGLRYLDVVSIEHRPLDRDVRCNRGFKQLRVDGERSERSLSHFPPTGCVI